MNQQLEIDWGDELPVAVPSNESRSDAQPIDAEGETSLEAALDPALLVDPVRDLGQEETEEATHGRIRHLERALEQCQHYIHDLKRQLIDQAFLEAQLAATEEFSHIQKQAIVTLKGQQSSQAELDQTELDHLRQDNLALTAQLETVSGQSEHQTSEIELLRKQLKKGQTSLKETLGDVERLVAQQQLSQDTAVQETQQRIIAQTTAERLRTSLRETESTVHSLESQLKQAHATVTEQQGIIDALKTTSQRDSHKNQAIQNLSTTLLKAQTKITDLESKLANTEIVQAQFQHSAQEYGAKANELQDRSVELEQQVAEMQEQILQQAQQAHEYETAIQHWKDRCLESEYSLGQMKQVMEHLLCDRQNLESLSEHQLETAIAEIAASLPEAQLVEANARKNPMLDLPSIMTRWRSPKS